jgi:alcohol dehydrogenase class IV
MTAIYGIDHGLAVALTLHGVLRKNLSSIIDADSLVRAFGGTDTDCVKTWMEKVTEKIAPLKLSSFGLKKDDINVIVNEAFTEGRMDNNTVSLTKEDVKLILEDVY